MTESQGVQATPALVSSRLVQLEIEGFRSIRSLSLVPGRMCALVGEANAGKSNVLAAIRALLDPSAPPIARDDLRVGGPGAVRIQGRLGSGETLQLAASPPSPARASRDGAPTVLFLPASARAGSVLVASPPRDSHAAQMVELFKAALEEQLGAGRVSATAPALSVLEAIECCCAAEARGLVFLIEEPELYLRPQAQRYLYRLLGRLAEGGNQVIYSTHSPAFLNVARLEELVFVERGEAQGTSVVQPQPVAEGEEFRVFTEFDAERSELFLARAAMLVEGMTEKIALPFVFQALGQDADRLGISIVECGGKPNIPLVARVCRAVGVPFLVLHDRDAPAGRQPVAAERALNHLIAEVAGRERTVVLEPDFEGVSGLRGHSHKPERAWRRFAQLAPSEIAPPLVRVVELAVRLATQS